MDRYGCGHREWIPSAKDGPRQPTANTPVRDANLPPFISTRDDGVTLAIRVQPRASSDGIAGTHGDALKVRVTAPPVDAAANEAVVALFARTIGCPPSAVQILRGHASRSKVLFIRGATADDIARRLMADEGNRR